MADGSRTLIKHGDPDALALLGVSRGHRYPAHRPHHDRDSPAIGEAVTFTFELADGEPSEVIIDYRLHYAGATGRRPKVVNSPAAASNPIDPRRSLAGTRFEHVSIHRVHPGLHTVDAPLGGVDHAPRRSITGRDRNASGM